MEILKSLPIGIIVFIVVVAIIILLIALPHCAGKCAQVRGRDYGVGFLGSFIFTPLITMFVLLCLGETDKRRKERILEEETWRIGLREKSGKGGEL